MTLPNCYRCKSSPCRCADGITLIHGDCREVLPLIAPGSVDLVLTDPPYGTVNKFKDQVTLGGSGSHGRRRLSFEWDNSEAVGEAVGEAVALRKQPAAAICFVGLDTVAPVQDAMRAAGMTPKPLAWVKKCHVPPMKGNWWPSAFELGIYAYDSGAYFADERPYRRNVWVVDSYRHGQPGKNGHPTQKPLSMIRQMAEAACRPGGLILDPFAGSGTTLVAAKQLGRRALGVEIEAKYCEIASQRLRQGILPFEALSACDTTDRRKQDSTASSLFGPTGIPEKDACDALE